MVAISFSVFKDKLVDGSKRQTIRRFKQTRYDQLKGVRDKPNGVQIYWHQRQKDSEKLMDGKLTFIKRFKFYMFLSGWSLSSYIGGNKYIILDNQSEIDTKIAKEDGFDSFYDMVQWFLNKYGSETLRSEVFMLIRWQNNEM